MGLPGAGKTTLANELAPKINALILGASSLAKVVLPAPGKPITKIIFIKYLLEDGWTLIQVHFHQLNIVVQA